MRNKTLLSAGAGVALFIGAGTAAAVTMGGTTVAVEEPAPVVVVIPDVPAENYPLLAQEDGPELEPEPVAVDSETEPEPEPSAPPEPEVEPEPEPEPEPECTPLPRAYSDGDRPGRRLVHSVPEGFCAPSP